MMAHGDEQQIHVDSHTRQSAGPAERGISAGQQAFGAGWRPSRRASAPGRIELIGNHLDYNGGPVLAAAIDREVVAWSDTNGPPGTIGVSLADVPSDIIHVQIARLGDWRNPSNNIEPADYVSAVAASLVGRGHGCRDSGRIAVASNVPIGLGVSSSAALCIALSLTLSASELTPHQLVLTAQEAEHRAGTPCGTMDQSASVAGEVIRFDGATLGTEKLEPDLGTYTFLIADSGVDRSLGNSVYPRRVEEAKRALQLANTALTDALPHLAAMTRQELAWLADEGVLTGDLLRRCRHVVTETQRVTGAERAMTSGDWPTFGKLMTASGRSSAADYDVSHPRVEELVSEILSSEGVLGARMMGGGGGGSVLALLEDSAVDWLQARLNAGYLSTYEMADRSDAVQRCKFGPAASIKPVTS
ncbi:MAG: galactokinase [Thermomicrobiales bacterium]